MLRTTGCSELCEGLQAHPSTSVSPKALEAAIQFPCIIQLEEVVRHSTWPAQFQENSPKEDNIALFFFAKDIERLVRPKFHFAVVNMLLGPA